MIPLDTEHTRRAVERIGAAREQRRQKVLAILAANPEIRHAWLTDNTAHDEFVILVLAIRDTGTCELSIARERYDGFKLLDVLEQRELAK